MDETVVEKNLKKLGRIGKYHVESVFGDYIWRGIWESQYSNN